MDFLEVKLKNFVSQDKIELFFYLDLFINENGDRELDYTLSGN